MILFFLKPLLKTQSECNLLSAFNQSPIKIMEARREGGNNNERHHMFVGDRLFNNSFNINIKHPTIIGVIEQTSCLIPHKIYVHRGGVYTRQNAPGGKKGRGGGKKKIY